jgi:hypothetical protein
MENEDLLSHKLDAILANQSRAAEKLEKLENHLLDPKEGIYYQLNDLRHQLDRIKWPPSSAPSLHF